MSNNPSDLDCEFMDDEERYGSVGPTDNSRFLLVVWTVRNGKVRAVTAFPASPSNKRDFLERPQ
jgi:uncharacterized DUF497 family protein